MSKKQKSTNKNPALAIYEDKVAAIKNEISGLKEGSKTLIELGYISQEEYNKQIDDLRDFLRN